MSDTSETYRTPARLLHWIMAILVLLTIPAGFVMIQEGLARPVQNTLFVFHKNVGVILLLLVLLRLVYRWLRPAPPMPQSLHPLQAVAARASHAVLYVLLLVMPLAGYVRVRAGRFPIEGLDALGIGTLVPKSEALANAAKAVHFYGAFAIAALIALHIGAALLHGLILRDGVFARMWPPRAPRK